MEVTITPIEHPKWDYRIEVIHLGRARQGFVSGGMPIVEAQVNRFKKELIDIEKSTPAS